MVGAVALRPVFTDETALSLYQKNFFLNRYSTLVPEAPLIPEIIEDREIAADYESCGYDRFGQMSRIKAKGLFVDSYH
jgi:hypothetical protein